MMGIPVPLTGSRTVEIPVEVAEWLKDILQEKDGGDQHSDTGWKEDELWALWVTLDTAIAKSARAWPGQEPDDPDHPPFAR